MNSDEGCDEPWVTVMLRLPEVVAERMEQYADGCRVKIGPFAVICILQGFALQLQDNGEQDLADQILLLACEIGEAQQGALITHRVVAEYVAVPQADTLQ